MMQRLLRILPIASALAFVGFFGTCSDSGSGPAPPSPQGTEPQTYLTRGPADSSDTDYRVRIGWGAVLDEGTNDYFEIAWESPTNWEGPITVPESLFATSADLCCATPLPQFAGAGDSTYSRPHTLYVRAVSKGGLTDQTPARISFTSKSVAPSTAMLDVPPDANSPNDLESLFCPDPVFHWDAVDMDGTIASYEYLLTSNDDYRTANGSNPANFAEMIAWITSLPATAWSATTETSQLYVGLTPTVGTAPANQYVFAVRAIDNSGNRELVLDPIANVRRFDVQDYQNGPGLTVRARASNNALLGSWSDTNPGTPLALTINQGVRFEFIGLASPSTGCRPLAGFAYREPGSSTFTPFSESNIGFPFQDAFPGPELWRPQTAGSFSLVVRVIDVRDFVTEVIVPITVSP
jgi:hypothetical protein